MKSNIFDWQYELDAWAPVITTKDDMFAVGNAYNQSVGIELLEGKMTLVDVVSKKQVATFAGELDTWARENYPSPEVIEQNKDIITGMKSEVNSLVAEVVTSGKTMSSVIAARKADEQAAGVSKRAYCGCPFIIFYCAVTDGCAGACVLVFCTG